MENFYKHFGWAIANNKNGHKKLRNQGFKYALNSFREIPRERLTTVEDDDVKFIESRIKHEGFYQKPDKRMKISWYGVTSPREDFAESYSYYRMGWDVSDDRELFFQSIVLS